MNTFETIDQIFDIERGLIHIFDNCINMDNEQIERALDGLLGNTFRVIMRIRAQHRAQELRVQPSQPVQPAVRRPVAQLRPRSRPSPRPNADGQNRLRGLFASSQYWNWDNYNSVCVKKRAIGHKKYNTNCLEGCAICLDNHTYGESIMTECNHSFGKLCWQTWMNNPNSNHNCPSCRKVCPNIISYTLKATQQAV
jgi:hypothetical protein